MIVRTALQNALSLAVVLLVAGGVVGANDVHLITSFESEEEMKTLLGTGSSSYDLRIEWSQERSTHGNASAQISFAPYSADPSQPGRSWWPRRALSLGTTEQAVTDWSDYRRVELDVFNAAEDPQTFGVALLDAKGQGESAAYYDLNLEPREWKTFSFDTLMLSAPEIGVDCSQMKEIQLRTLLYVRGPKFRTVFFVDNIRLIPKAVDEQAVKVTVTEPSFRGAFYASCPARNVRGVVQFDFPSWEQDNEAEVVLLGAGDETLGRQVLTTTSGEQTVVFPLSAPPSPQRVKELTLRITVTSPQGKQLLVVDRTLPVRPAAPDEVIVDERNRLLVNGRPFFPIGIYGPPLSDLGSLAAMGFNCVGPYIAAKSTRKYIAEAKKHGLRLIVDSPRDAEEAREFSESGAILGYYMYDEPPSTAAGEHRQRCLAMAELDPYHPTVGCIDSLRKHPHYKDVADVMMVDIYGQPGPFDGIISGLGSAVKTMRGRRQVWFIPQAFPPGTWSPIGREKIYPYNQFRSVAWLGIVQGVKGFVYYETAVLSYRVRDADPIQWRALGYIVGELRALANILLWPMKRIESSSQQVHAAMFRKGDRALIAVVNAGMEAVDATINAPGLGTYHVLGEGRDVECVEGQLQDHFAPQTLHLYVNWSLPAPVDVIAAHEELDRLQAEYKKRRLDDNVALCWRGATLEASCGFLPEGTTRKQREGHLGSWPPEHMNDGYRGTNWPLGFGGNWHSGLWGSDRWFQVTFAQEEVLDRAIVVTANVDYQFAVYQDGQWRVIPPASEEPYVQYLGTVKTVTTHYWNPWFQITDETDYEHEVVGTIRTFPLGGLKSDRVRLIVPNPPPPGKREVYYEIEVYRAKQR